MAGDTVLSGKCVVLGVTGGIAAYKSAEIVSRLRKLGADVRVVMTRAATQFIAPLTMATLSAHEVALDMFAMPEHMQVEHIALAKRADVFLIAPATANFIGKLACGIADDMLTTTVMATGAPIVIAPAMNSGMWESAAVASNMHTLRARGVLSVGPDSGPLACGDIGAGRMSDPSLIVDEVCRLLTAAGDMRGLCVVVTAGPTREHIDPVRYLTNRSSGRMGYAIAAEAKARGARVTLVSGPVALNAPAGVERVDIETTAQLYERMIGLSKDADIIIQAAAPADYRPRRTAPHKISKREGALKALELVETIDVAAALGENKPSGQTLVVFAAQTRDLMNAARDKLSRKRADLVVANDVTASGAGFDVDTNIVTLIDSLSETQLPVMPKTEVARVILDRVMELRG